jgi:diguanylate cyclase (GGDEF)-like protein
VAPRDDGRFGPPRDPRLEPTPRPDGYAGLHCARGDRRASIAYLVAAAVIITSYPFLSETPRMLGFLFVSLTTVPFVVIGLRRTPAGDRGPWWFLLAALISLNADNLTWYWYVYVQRLPTGDGTVSGLFAALGQICMFAGALAIVARRGRNDVGGLIDTTIVSMAAGGVIWYFLLLPHLRAVHMVASMQVSTGVAVFMLTGVLGALARMLLTTGRFIPALWLLVGALTCSLSGIVTVSLLLDPVTGARPGWTDVIYLGGYTALGLFGLDRSVGELLRPGPAPSDDLTGGRLVFLGLALAAMPIVGGVRQLLGREVDGLLVAVGAAVVTPLVMVRIGRLSSERSWAEWAVRHWAGHDGLTGLPSRQEFVNRLTGALRDERRPVVLFCDLDGFKAVNDRFGHAGGDRLLIEVAARLRRCVRDRDLVSRFGGDEFVILCRGGHPDSGTGTDAVSELCRRIEYVLSRPIELDGEPVLLGASVGTVTADGKADAEELIHRADVAMYTAKQRRHEAPGVRVHPP